MSSLHKKQVYAGILEILKDNKYYYYSTIGDNYCHFSEEGKIAIIDYIEQVAPTIIKKEQLEFEQRAKSTVWNELSR